MVVRASRALPSWALTYPGACNAFVRPASGLVARAVFISRTDFVILPFRSSVSPPVQFALAVFSFPIYRGITADLVRALARPFAHRIPSHPIVSVLTSSFGLYIYAMLTAMTYGELTRGLHLNNPLPNLGLLNLGSGIIDSDTSYHYCLDAPTLAPAPTMHDLDYFLCRVLLLAWKCPRPFIISRSYPPSLALS